MTHTERTARFAQISTALALQSDEQLTRLVETAEQLASGIGGTTLAIELDGCKVFAKRVRLTDLERRSENRMSTGNIFQLPTFCQRNVGSVGFGVWRELAANSMTTGWVLSQQSETFPLMYHWRVLEGAASAGAAPLPDELADVEGMVSYWDGSESMGLRLKALADATASVMIFLEYLPWNLSVWLEQQLAAGPAAMESACAMVERGLTVDIPLMNSLGLVHGDAHFGNILTDGHRLYFADLGLSTSERFALTPDELNYLHHNASLDRAYVLAKWVNWLIKAFAPTASSLQERMALVRAVAEGQAVHQLIPELPSEVAAIIHRHAAIASLVNDFYVKLHSERRSAQYPRDDIEAALSAVPRRRLSGDRIDAMIRHVR
jgi:tRNA A-37 threonylcarbamoyl transferase component Bud32